MMTDKPRLVTKEQASFTELIDHKESIVLDLDSLHYYSLNAAATLLWKHLRSGSATTVEELSDKLATAFGLSPETSEWDTRQFVEELQQDQLIAFTSEAVAGRASFSFPAAGELPAYEPPRVRTSNAVLEMNLASGSSVGATGALGGGS